MNTGLDAFIGHPPRVAVIERKLLSDLPECEREAFAQHLGPDAERTRSGEIVFDVRKYDAWKSKQ